jgi:hypothetical protein
MFVQQTSWAGIRMVCGLIVWLMIAGAAAPASAEDRLRCVTPMATTTGNGALHRRFINVYTQPSRSSTIMSYTIAAPLSLWVVAESGGFSRVTTGDSMAEWPFKPRTTLGWVRNSDVEDEPFRNCT